MLICWSVTWRLLERYFYIVDNFLKWYLKIIRGIFLQCSCCQQNLGSDGAWEQRTLCLCVHHCASSLYYLLLMTNILDFNHVTLLLLALGLERMKQKNAIQAPCKPYKLLRIVSFLQKYRCHQKDRCHQNHHQKQKSCRCLHGIFLLHSFQAQSQQQQC